MIIYVFGNIFCFRVHIKIQNKVISCSAEYFIPYWTYILSKKISFYISTFFLYYVAKVLGDVIFTKATWQVIPIHVKTKLKCSI